MTGLLEVSRIRFDFDAPVLGVAASGPAFFFALADGSIEIITEKEQRIGAHQGVSLCLAPHRMGVLSGGDDGRLLLVSADGATKQIGDFGRGWINAVAVATETGLVAAASGKRLHIFGPDFEEAARFDHPSTVMGVDFDPRGKRVVAAHYNGASVWMAANKTATPRGFNWKGSHLSVRWSPCGRFIVTAMQENALHGWRVEDSADFRMDGYPMRVRAIAFAERGRKLATTGAGPEVLLWPFVGPKGPMGKAAEVLTPDSEDVAVALAARPKLPEIAVGYEDGAVRLFSTETGVGYVIEEGAGASVVALDWSADGAILGFGRADGSSGILKVAN